ncbi:MAG: adenosylcobalamin-dependent ribonucleoside-diphosphate reductase [Methanobacteriota archaeon]|nr:MAG: adenosylcobalamin-dependent ribonucleoside-diphosphate reductase [Euryarchaeota archaeon]
MTGMEVLKDATDAVPEGIRVMFDYKSKLSEKVPAEWLERYKRLYYHLRAMQADGKLPTHPNYLGSNELAESIYKKKYYLKDLNNKHIEEKPEDVFVRLAAFMASVEDDGVAEEWAEKFYNSLYEGHWLPGGRVIAGAGDLYRFKTLANCFVSMIEHDNIESIYKAAYEAARTYSYGGGIGIDITPLRPENSVVHNAADKSTGAVSFMELYSLTTGLIGQSGRRGALMLTLDVKHPDVVKFIKVKQTPNWVTNQIVQQLTWASEFNARQLEAIKKAVMENTQVRFANISLKVSDEFMHAVWEQNNYGSQYLIYKKMNKTTIRDIEQDEETVHYSDGIPSKDISSYELVAPFKSFTAMAEYIHDAYGLSINEEDFNNAQKRDVYGDYVIELKEQSFDLALRRAGDFMVYFASNNVGSIKKLYRAREIWNSFVEGNYKTAEPGLMFWTTMKKYSPSDVVGRPIISTNPCGEVPLEDGGSCNLGSINLSRFVNHPYTEKASIAWKKLEKATEIIHRFLDNVIDWNILLNPLEKQRLKASRDTRRIGIGVMGIADMLNQLSIAYDSEEGIKTIEEVMRRITNSAYVSSSKVAAEKGSFPLFDYEKYAENNFFKEALDESTKKAVKKNGLRNVAIMSIAPTGTISNAVKSFEYKDKNYIGVSGGVEPIFALFYTRRSESFGNKFFKLFHSTVRAYLEMKGLYDEAQNSTEEVLKDILPEHFFRTAHHIDPMRRVEIQAVIQKYIDHSISSTVNLPEDISPEIISDIYLYAWQKRLKGITIYREGSRFPILSVEGKKTEFQQYKEKKFKIVVDGKEYVAHGDEVISLPSGKLTTVYHGIKAGLFEEVRA